MGFYVTNIIGDGSENNPYRSSIAGQSAPWRDHSATILTSNGVPIASWALAECPDVVTEVGIDKLSPNANKAALDAILTNRGVQINESAPEYVAALNRLV